MEPREEEHGAKLINIVKETQKDQQYLCQGTDLLLFYRICLCFDLESRNDGGPEPHDCVQTLSLDFLETNTFVHFSLCWSWQISGTQKTTSPAAPMHTSRH